MKPPPPTYEQLLNYRRELRGLGFDLAAPAPGWMGWDTWYVQNLRRGSIRRAPAPEVIMRFLIRARRRREMQEKGG